MKRIHLFELEDFRWFPNPFRKSMTRTINVMHKLIKTERDLGQVIDKTLADTQHTHIIDLCSGSGGPMIDIVEQRNQDGKPTTMALTDLYPNLEAAKRINDQYTNIHYETKPVDATALNTDIPGLRTMVCSFHHMSPQKGRAILEAAYKSRQPICIYEISDNSFPIGLWWVPIPINFMMCMFITPLVKPLRWYQIVFTYIVPIIPVCFAWDGAVSNARTYTHDDLNELLQGLEDDTYTWEKGTVKGPQNKLYLIGKPKM